MNRDVVSLSSANGVDPMRKRNPYRDSPDPEAQRWAREYPKFPGVAECVRLIVTGKARGTWLDIIVHEMAENAVETLDEMIAAFREHEHEYDGAAKFLMMALEIAAIPASLEFLAAVLDEGKSQFVPYARRALEAIDTRESRTALFRAAHRDRTRPSPQPET